MVIGGRLLLNVEPPHHPPPPGFQEANEKLDPYLVRIP